MNTALIVLGIDLSLTGTALVRLTRLPASLKVEALSLQVHGKLRGMVRLDKIRAGVELFLEEALPHMIMIEGYAYGAKQGREQAGELGGLVRHAIWRRGLDYRNVPPSVVKAYATGKGNAPKEVVMREVFRRWQYEASDNNDADAFTLARLGVDGLTSASKKARELYLRCEEVVGR
jgi:crossover junction endodeoxyribonuclease RuvC